MFLDAFDIYLAGGVLGALLKEGWSTLQLNATFVSSTFIGMTLGAWFSGILGDRFGRRFTYQVNLAIFGLASIAAAFAPSMTVLIACRFVIGIGLGAEIVVGYATLTEFVPASSRGRWIGLLAVITNFSLFASSMVGLWVIPTLGWRYMFGIVGVLAMFVWILRKSMPESPRWLAAHGRGDEAEKILQAIEAEAARKGPLPPVQSISRDERPAGSVWKLFQPPFLGRTLLGSLLHIVVGFSLYGFIGWLPTFLIKDGHSVVSSLGYTTLMSLGGPVGSLIGLALTDIVGRKASIVGFRSPPRRSGLPIHSCLMVRRSRWPASAWFRLSTSCWRQVSRCTCPSSFQPAIACAAWRSARQRAASRRRSCSLPLLRSSPGRGF
jgi:putative MFS transporter